MNKNMNNTNNASVSANKRNRHQDAINVISLLATLKKTSETASHFEERRDNFESCKAALTQILATAPEKDDNASVTLGSCRYMLNTSGVESMLTHMDQLNDKYQKAATAKDELPVIVTAYAAFISDVIESNTAHQITPTPVNQTTFSNSRIENHGHLMQSPPTNDENAGTPCVHCPDNGNEDVCVGCVDRAPDIDMTPKLTTDYEYLRQQIHVLSDRLDNLESNAGKRDALALDVVKLYERIQIIEGRVGELEDIGERVPDLDEEIGDIYRRINTLEEKAKPPIKIPAEVCDPNKLMKLFGIHQDCTDTTATNAEDGCKIPTEMESIDIPEILDADVQTGDIMALDTNDITAVHTGDIKVGRIGHNINIKIGGDVVINGDDDIK